MPGPALALPWSPIVVRASTTGPPVRRAVGVATGVAIAAGLALFLAPASGTDLAAQRARAAFAAAHPGAAVDLRWFAGVFPAAYSVLTPYVEAVLGARITGIAAAVASAPLLALLLCRWRVRRPVAAAAYGGIVLVANMASGRTAFALGVTLALAALVLVPAAPARARRRWAAAMLLGVLTALASPVAAAFLCLVGVVWALQRRAVLLVVLAAGAPLGVIGLAFPEPGSMPYTWPVLRPLLLGCLAVALLCRRPLLQAGAVLYAVAAAVIYAAPGPVGSNIERLGLLFTGVALVAEAALAVPLVVVAALVAGQWTARDPWHDLRQSSAVATEAAASHRLVRILDGLGPLTGRVEVVPFLDHGESDVVARHALLARGWERQVDTVRAAPLYRRQLSPSDYLSWLRRNSVEYVALGRHRHDWSAAAELRLLGARPGESPPAGVPGLEVVHADGEWTVWRVTGSTPLLEGSGLVRLGAAAIVVTASAPVHINIRWSDWLSVSVGACIRAATGSPAGGVELRPAHPGTFTLSSSYLAPVTGRHC